MNRHGSMNRIYRLIFSNVRSAWVPVAETARGRGKAGRARSISRTLLGAALSLALSPLAHAAPTGGQIVAGSGSITSSGNTTDIRQTSQDLSINWQSFNIGPQQWVDFLQPSASAIAVNRIFSTNGSEILGHLDANGQVYLINPNGIIFGQGAEVNVGGLVASTLALTDAGLGGSTRSFAGNGTGSIVNDGTISAATSGYVALLGNRVSNQGVISAQLGTVALGAGSAVNVNENITASGATAALAINPNTANGTERASGAGTLWIFLLRDYSALRASPLRGRPSGVQRRCATLSNPYFSLSGVRILTNYWTVVQYFIAY
jgi:filamentous hemagglutinin family protein